MTKFSNETKVTQDGTRLEFEEEALYVVLPRRIVETHKPMTQAQTSAMTFLCAEAAKQPTGYDPVPIEALRCDPAIFELLDMLETCRPGWGDGEAAFIAKYILPFEPHRDDYGNHYVTVDVPEGHPRILWSCHTDTVHRHDGAQTVETTSGMAWTSDGSCLGSDDGVGIWLAMAMIRAKVPGTYVFHRDEESGGQGSRWLSDNGAEFLGQFDCAIALDRAGYKDVITHQGGGRCCSDAFAKSLAAVLGGGFRPDDSGVFTDTANYVDLIGECTNLSVGYHRQHGPMEHTNLSFAYSLRDALVAADWSKLVFERKPGEMDPAWGQWDDYDDKYGTYTPRKQGTGAAYGRDKIMLDEMEQFIREHPWVAAEFLYELGYTTEDLDLYEPGDLG